MSVTFMSINLRIVNSRPVSGFPVQFLSWVNVNIKYFFHVGKKVLNDFHSTAWFERDLPKAPR